MVNAKLDISICGPTSVFHFDPHPYPQKTHLLPKICHQWESTWPSHSSWWSWNSLCFVQYWRGGIGGRDGKAEPAEPQGEVWRVWTLGEHVWLVVFRPTPLKNVKVTGVGMTPTTPQCVICIVIYSIKCVFLYINIYIYINILESE